jgi:dihydroorotate dehydrogenase
MYKLLRTILFCFDPEKVHYFSMKCLKAGCAIPWIRRSLEKYFQPKEVSLERNLFGLQFSNPVGLGAGFDKNATYLRELKVLGFGFVEIGTVTPVAQPGNPRPRLFRLPQDHAIINRMGFNNDGVVTIADRLYRFRHAEQNAPSGPGGRRLIIGGNIGKNKNTANEDAWKDYATCFELLHPLVDFFVVNVSSPNTPGLRDLQQKDSLKKILVHLQQINRKKPAPKPILLKIAPDLSPEELDDVLDLALEISLDGLVATNTTIRRDRLKTPSHKIEKIGAGGLSGKPLEETSLSITRYIARKTHGKIPLIASGGIFSGEDAMNRLLAGASLLEIWTGFIYEGPCIVRTICRSLP